MITTVLTSGLFQIVGPLANPSLSDLASLDTTEADIQSLPSKRLASANISSNMLAGDFANRRLSLEAQLQPIDPLTARKWSSFSKSRSCLLKQSRAELPERQDANP